MRVLHYVDENRLSWAAPWLQLLEGLETAGLQNAVACRPGGTLEDRVREKGFEVVTYRPILQLIPELCRGFGKIVERIQPDLIHTRLSSAALIGGYWGKKIGIPVASTIDKYPKGKYYRYTDLLVACSNAVASHMRTQGFSGERIAVIHNPVEAARYTRNAEIRASFRAEKGIKNDDLVVLGAGRLVDWKGFDRLVMAFSRVQTPRIRLWIVGSGPEEKKIREEIERSGARATLFPFAEDIRPFLWAADVFVQPSTEPEGFSLMLLEAMGAGLPVIATRIGGTTDILRDGVEGKSVQPGSVDGLAAALEELLNFAPEGLERMSRSAEQRCLDFSVPKIVEKTLALYESLASSPVKSEKGTAAGMD